MLAHRAEHIRQDARKIVGTTVHPTDHEARVATLKAERRSPAADGVVFCEKLPAIRLDELPLGEQPRE